MPLGGTESNFPLVWLHLEFSTAFPQSPGKLSYSDALILGSIEDVHRKKIQEFYIILMNQVCNVETGLKVGEMLGQEEERKKCLLRTKICCGVIALI